MISCSDQAALLVVGDWAVRCDNRNNPVVAQPLSGIGKSTTSGRWDCVENNCSKGVIQMSVDADGCDAGHGNTSRTHESGVGDKPNGWSKNKCVDA